MNLTVAPSPLLAPTPPDFYHCSQFYAKVSVPDYDDCDTAVNLLPSGNAPIPWYLDPERGNPEILSYTATHETCTLQMQVAGQDAVGSRQNWISGNFMRQMARLVMDKCIIAHITGGYVTRNFKKQVDYVTSPNTKYEKAFPPRSAFLTMMVRDSDSAHDQHNPGDQDPYVGQVLMDSLEAAVYMAPKGSLARANLKRNFDHWYETVQKMDGTRDWWQEVPQTSDNLAKNNSVSLVVNLTTTCGIVAKDSVSPSKPCLQLVGLEGSNTGSEA